MMAAATIDQSAEEVAGFLVSFTSSGDILDRVTARASPLILERRPIGTAVAVALDNMVVSRSRTSGFELYPEANTLAFHNLKFKKGSWVLVGYRVWDSIPWL